MKNLFLMILFVLSFATCTNNTNTEVPANVIQPTETGSGTMPASGINFPDSLIIDPEEMK